MMIAAWLAFFALSPSFADTGEYRFAAVEDPQVLAGRKTEVWARVVWPETFSAGPYPLVVFLHGNHGTCGYGENPRIDNNCQYTEEGTCPDGFVVTPNHDGYNYLAKTLAQAGYVVVSINANRGITCGAGIVGDFGLVLARGRLVLKHLKLLKTWSTHGGAPDSLGLGADGLVGKIDWTRVGLLGHSRGGEGMRAAYNLLLDEFPASQNQAPLKIRAIYEIGSVDGQSDRVLDAPGVAWNQLLPMCDGDVSSLEGRQPYFRMLQNTKENLHAQKSLSLIWGANHNFFNTEWQTSESNGCMNHNPIFNASSGSPEQQKIAATSVLAFFNSHLHPDARTKFNRLFNPLFEVPQVLTALTRIEREFTVSPSAIENLRMEEFDRETGTNSYGYQNVAEKVQVSHELVDGLHRGAQVTWQSTNSDVYFETVWAGVGSGRDVHEYRTLDFRVAPIGSTPYPSKRKAFDLQLIDASGKNSNRIPIEKYVDVLWPVHPMTLFQTVRIPLKEFRDIDLSNVHSLRFVFDRGQADGIHLANIRFSHSLGLGAEAFKASPHAPMHRQAQLREINKANGLRSVVVDSSYNRIRAIRRISPTQTLRSGAVEIELQSKRWFPVSNALAVLRIGSRQFALSSFGAHGRTDTLIFRLHPKEFNATHSGDAVQIRFGKRAARLVWKFGALDKSILK